MIIVRVKYRTPEGQRDAFLQQLFDEGLPQACRAEEGNICYDYFLNYEDPNEILLLEMWKDGTALAKHGKEPHFDRIGQVRREAGVQATIESYDSKQRK